MLRQRTLVERLAKRAGLSLIADWRLEKYPQAVYLERLFAAGEVDCVFDVGANLGQYRDFLRDEVGYRGAVVSFEPIPEHAQAMRARAAADPNWIVEACALGRSPGRAVLHVMHSTQFSSFRAPRHDAEAMFARQNSLTRDVDVEVRMLDDVFVAVRERLGFKTPYLKLDTQGFDLEVAAGATARLGEFLAIQSEASVKPIYEGMPGYTQTIEWFCRQGFELSAMFPNNPDHFPKLVEFDCHFVATSAVPRLAKAG